MKTAWKKLAKNSAERFILENVTKYIFSFIS